MNINFAIFCVISLKDAFSLLAYADPWSSPVGYQLDPVQREPVCAALNSAILGKMIVYIGVLFYYFWFVNLQFFSCVHAVNLLGVSLPVLKHYAFYSFNFSKACIAE